jgi:hypothetical protein
VNEAESHQSRWRLLHRPFRLGGIVALFCFACFCFVSAPRSPLDFVACAICTVGYMFLFDFYQKIAYPKVLRFLHWGLFIPSAFLFAMACGFGAAWLGQRFHIPLTLMHPVQFMVTISAGGAIGSVIGGKIKAAIM